MTSVNSIHTILRFLGADVRGPRHPTFGYAPFSASMGSTRVARRAGT